MVLTAPILSLSLGVLHFNVAKIEHKDQFNNEDIKNVITYADYISNDFKLSIEDINALAVIAFQESRYRPRAHNRRSSAYGLFQFLNKTWRTVDSVKTSDPVKQTQAAVRYILKRYGTIGKALDHHNNRGWY